jgi:hypothetical protein
VAPLLKLLHAADKSAALLRFARTLELRERALACADATLPQADSLVHAHILTSLASTRLMMTDGLYAAGQSARAVELVHAAWRNDDAHIAALSRRAFELLFARWRAGSLLALTPEEAAAFAALDKTHIYGAELYVRCTHEALTSWPAALHADEEEEARARGVHGALRAVLELDARGHFQERAAVFCGSVPAVVYTLQLALDHSSSSAGGGVLPHLRSMALLTRADETALRLLELRLDRMPSTARTMASTRRHLATDVMPAAMQRAAADVACHGLRRCSLPTCGAAEPQPKAFKVCGRCRGAAYCCPAHAKEDWKRHKRADGCTAE